MNRNEELNAQSDRRPVPGVIIVLDLDRFGDFVEERGLDPYKPNLVTGELTHLVEYLATKYRGVIVYGLSYERGTEEAIIEIPFGVDNVDALMTDFEYIKQRIESLGASISIVAIRDYVLCKKARDRKEAYFATPGRRRALKLLRILKNKGGSRVLSLI